MGGWLILIIGAAVVGLGFVANHFGWIDLSNKSRSSGSSGGGAFGIADEVFNPSKYEAQVELDRQTILPAPAPIPGDGADDPLAGTPDVAGNYAGQVRIDLNTLPKK
jgi:hypothetical protein